MPPKQAPQREPEEFPLAHDAATWDENTCESDWDDEQARLVRDLARAADGPASLHRW